MKNRGDKCEAKNCDQRIIVVNGAAVCPRCDHVEEWPSVKRGTARIET